MLLSNLSFKQLISYNRMYQPDGFSVLYCMYTQLIKTTRIELWFSLRTRMFLWWMQKVPSQASQLMVWHNHYMYILHTTLPQPKPMWWPTGDYIPLADSYQEPSLSYISIVDLCPQYRCWSYTDERRVSAGSPLPSRWRGGKYPFLIVVFWHTCRCCVNFCSF